MSKIKTKRERVKFASDNVAGACPEVLKALLNVERKLGRERNLEKGYQDRTIDLDLLFYNSEIIHSEELKKIRHSP